MGVSVCVCLHGICMCCYLKTCWHPCIYVCKTMFANTCVNTPARARARCKKMTLYPQACMCVCVCLCRWAVRIDVKFGQEHFCSFSRRVCVCARLGRVEKHERCRRKAESLLSQLSGETIGKVQFCTCKIFTASFVLFKEF